MSDDNKVKNVSTNWFIEEEYKVALNLNKIRGGLVLQVYG